MKKIIIALLFAQSISITASEQVKKNTITIEVENEQEAREMRQFLKENKATIVDDTLDKEKSMMNALESSHIMADTPGFKN